MSRTLKFRLTDNNIFEFKYSKYSEFIDNLEPEPEVIIDVLEPFTLEEFETAQIEYNKYVVFKEALEDIIKNKNLWSKEELKELSKYELNNPVLEWLMIMETRDEKEIKEKLSLVSFKLSEIKSDNIILYYFVDKINQDKFNWACEKGHLEVAQWLYSLGDVNIHIKDDEVFRWACQNGNLEVAQWLYSLGGVNIHFKDEEAFTWTCVYSHLKVAQWLYSLGGVDIHIHNDKVFRWACEKGHLKVAQWLYTLGDVNIHIHNEDAFRWACFYGHLEVAQWLWSLGGFHKEGIETEYQPIKDWFATLD